ncbi:fumarate reductase flavoprotein subunit precursor [bacterium BMS3Bbin10]|nr:fumarate reductase flavoprotein subunit precursor [bacterium BMS3Bbin10]
MQASVLKQVDVLVIGAGHAALCAAITARRHGASVLVLECAPRELRGGNSRHTRNIRCAHKAATDYVTGPYTGEEYWDDLLKVTAGRTNEALARMVIERSGGVIDWMMRQGVRFQPALSGTLGLSRTNAFFFGGGKTMMNALFHRAETLGVDILYDAQVTALEIAGGRCTGVSVSVEGEMHLISAPAIVVAAGGFEANIDWLKEGWGEAAENFLIRGTPYNTGGLLRILLDHGARPVGDADQCHAVPIDARSPKFDGGIATRVDCVTYSIMVNARAQRFYDEGEDIWPKRYAIWGRLVARQPGQIAYAIIDAKSQGLFMPTLYPAIEADSIRELAAKLELDADALEATVDAFNAAVQPGDFDAARLDGCHTRGIDPPKTNWARRLDTPPYCGYPLRPGITFTYLGVEVDERARVLFGAQKAPAGNVFAAGEIMAGNILGQGYVGGFGLLVGNVFGRIAGEEAARHAHA